MRKIFLAILGIILLNANINAQDTLYMYQNGAVVAKRAISEIDSVTFYKEPEAPITKIYDIDGNEYNLISVGNQTWVKENLKVTKYQNGDLISSNKTINNSIWAYDDDENNAQIYGYLYSWAAANDERGICPSGSHIPSDAEWTTFINNLGGETVAGGKLKEIGLSHWNYPNEGATDEIGFSALPTGLRDVNGHYGDLNGTGYFWSSTQIFYQNGNPAELAWYRYVNCGMTNIERSTIGTNSGLPVRCLKN
jgi:uncharacterized protein (TIGR02145 family)